MGSKHVVIAGGGTGGHLFPGVAVVEALQQIDPSVRASFVGTERGIEARVIPNLGYDLHLVEVRALKGKSLVDRLAGGLALPASLLKARALVRKIEPDVVISVGGYAAGPFTLAASLEGRPTALMEQNATPGMTNRILARFVDRAFLTFDDSVAFFPKTPCHVTGNPIRRSLLERAKTLTYAQPESNGEFRILVIGGSGGAGSLNEYVPELVKSMGDLKSRIAIRHQAGRGRAESVQPRYEGFEGKAEVVEFIDDMAEAYAWCHVLICRAGASTIAEVLALGIPAIYVPFPGAADNHQEKNALAVTEAGAGMMLHDHEIASQRAQSLLKGLILNPVALARVSARARETARPEAAREIASQILEMMK
jgi:UDP-N-acetylglucosamine--N-acetylmuramyl-(pentapeptide) pyrophosphoryl-undecaprenol N-acetylglucosamine transferase